jgi:hypothetical protein
MTRDDASKAAQLVAELSANVDAWYAGQIDYGTFGERQRVTWAAVDVAGRSVTEEVLRRLRRRDM